MTDEAIRGALPREAEDAWNGPAGLVALGHAFLLLTFIVGPLAFAPGAVISGSVGSGVLPVLLVPKVIVLSATVALGVAVWLVGSPQLRASRILYYSRRARPALVLATATAIAVVISAFFAASPLPLALTGNNARLDGALVTAMWLLLAPLTFAVVRRTRTWRAAVSYLALSFAILSVWLILEAYGLEPLALLNPTLGGSPIVPAAALGHPSIASIFEGLGVALFGFRYVSRPERTRGLMSATIVVLCAAGVGATGGRAAQVGLGVLWLLTATAVLGWRRKSLGSFIAVSVLAWGAFALVGFTAPRGYEKLQTYGSVVEGRNASFNHRLITWRAGLAAILERPVFGYGADMAASTVWQHVSPAEERELFTEFIPKSEVPSAVLKGPYLVYRDNKTGTMRYVVTNYDKAHNYLIDLGLANGAIVLALFVWMVVALLRDLFRSASVIAVGAGIAVAYYLFCSMAFFPNLLVDPFVWSLAGLGLAAAVRDSRQASGPT